MQTAEFAHAYEGDYTVPQRRGDDIDTIMLPARTFSGAWGELLLACLKGQLSAETQLRATTLETAYQSWFETVSDVLLRQLSRTLTASDSELMSALAELSFHRVNTHVTASWRRLSGVLGDDEAPAVEAAQARTAIRADIERLRAMREQIALSGEFDSDDVQDLERWYGGLVAHLAGVDALLEASLLDPDVVVLPAPVQFSASSAAPCDVVMINQLTEQALGIRLPSLVPDVPVDRARVLTVPHDDMGAQTVQVALRQLHPVEAQA